MTGDLLVNVPPEQTVYEAVLAAPDDDGIGVALARHREQALGRVPYLGDVVDLDRPRCESSPRPFELVPCDLVRRRAWFLRKHQRHRRTTAARGWERRHRRILRIEHGHSARHLGWRGDADDH